MIVDKLITRGFQEDNNTLLACNGIGLVNLLRAGTQWLENHVAVVNGLNVFPVPDGDTGTNLALTVRAISDHLKGNEACRITAKVPRNTIAINKKAETMIEAIDISFKILERKIHNLWKDVKIRNRHAKVARLAKRGVIRF